MSEQAGTTHTSKGGSQAFTQASRIEMHATLFRLFVTNK